MGTLDMIILNTDCPQCGQFRHLQAWIVPSGYDEDGHAHEIEVSEIKCPTCGYIPDENDKEWARVEELIYEVETSLNIMELGKIYQELK